MLTVHSFSLNDTEALGKRIATLLKGDEEIALFGDLGAGKTAFVRGLCAGLGFLEGVCSPTFAIVNVYDAKFPVYHFDMYRVETIDDLESTGFFDYLKSGVMVIEWSEHIVSELEDDAIRIEIAKTENENERIFTINGMDAYADIIC